MGSVSIVSGAPAAGKSSLCRRLAAASDRGLHLATDCFYAFPARPIDPSRPESHGQNVAIMKALARAAGAFAESGYDVFVDGVVGPWFLPLVAGELATAGFPPDYAILRANLAETLERAAARSQRVEERVVRQMHGAFAQLGPFEAYVLDTTGTPPERVVEEFRRRQAEGGFRLDADVTRGRCQRP
jgi:chloramphenicol 3-O-phosphotransferase